VPGVTVFNVDGVQPGISAAGAAEVVDVGEFDVAGGLPPELELPQPATPTVAAATAATRMATRFTVISYV
jgi:hypothetical protein